MQAKRIVRKYPDWLILAVLTMLIAAVAGAYFYLMRQNTASPSRLKVPTALYDVPEPHVLDPIDTKYPSPSGEQRAYNKIYTEGDLQYTVSWVVKNVERKPVVGNNEFTVDIKNTRNRPIEVAPSKSASFGCRVMENPYRDVSVERKSYQFGPYESKQQRLILPIQCLYIGTPDGKYWVAY